MTYTRSLSAMAFVLALGAAQPAFANAPFECPVKPLEVAQAANIRSQLPAGNALDNVEALNAAVSKLRAQGVSPVLIIDNMIAAYCPVVAAESGLSNAQKAKKVGKFASRATRVVYQLESEAEVILDVAFPPAVVAAINAKARAAGVTPDAWIQGVVGAALK